MKKIFSLFLVIVMLMSMNVVTFANSNKSDANFVHSEQFPDAYIITNIETGKQSRGSEIVNLDTIEATVFVEDTFGVIDGERVVVNSRLMSQEEVESVGVENFENYNPHYRGTASNSQGKLRITFSGSYRLSGSGVNVSLNGNAGWSGYQLFSSENSPASGYDFIGITWSGGHTETSRSVNGTYADNFNIDIYNAKSSPNIGRVWRFYEEFGVNSQVISYADNINVSMGLGKNNLEGNGNTAEAVLQYTHTYQSSTGSVSISNSGAGFGISSTPKQWELVCTLGGIPY